jgi:uncharacterized protein (TIGR02677 family)
MPGMSPMGSEAGGEELERLRAYEYLGTPDRIIYLGIMRLFVGSLLVDFSADEVADRLADRGVEVDVDVAADKLANLVTWGNLLRSAHTLKVTSIAEYHRTRSRFQLSRLGERIQRDVDAMLATADAAREVSREMLGLVDRGLAALADLVEQPGGADPLDAAERIGTIFVQFAEFADSVRDFYAYLGSVLSRYDLDGAAYSGFKDLLLDYVESITDEVSLLAPRVEASLDRLVGHLPDLLARIDAADTGGLGGLAAIDPGVEVRRSPGRALADWDALRGWFTGVGGTPSEVEQLRGATLRALQSLLANAKRMIRSASGEVSRRRDILRLARWFDEADTDEGHDLYVAAFGLYGARHLGVAGDPDAPLAASESWWTAPPVEVPVSLRERGNRAVRGRTAGVEDHSAQRTALLAAAEGAARARHSAAAELRGAAGRLERVRLSAAALSLLQELLSSALGAADARLAGAWAAAKDVDVRLVVIPAPGRSTLLRSAIGTLTLDGMELSVGAASTAPPALELPAVDVPERRAAGDGRALERVR